ncbi:transcriptional regulator, XRE family [Desulforamulus reducens MI-1]|uniref:Transcriptional regulator, XRE family n=2 Tax=Desulforamulus TaxID=2916693 RepID=A4J2X3_DESRM|nr:transcriptional regulator, XRE family [Desulforamulus reducens MI-1]
MLLMGIGENVIKLREAKNWSQQDLEEASKVPQSSISRIEKGLLRNPGVETVRKLATALNVSVAELLEEETSAKAVGE